MREELLWVMTKRITDSNTDPLNHRGVTWFMMERFSDSNHY